MLRGVAQGVAARRLVNRCLLCGAHRNQLDLLAVAPDVIAKAPTAKPEAVLSLARRHAFELLDRKTAAPIVRIGLEDRQRRPKEWPLTGDHSSHGKELGSGSGASGPTGMA